MRHARPGILCVDDEPAILESLRDTPYEGFDVRIASSVAEALARLGEESDGYALIISDMQMPLMPGSVFLRDARRIAPDATRNLLTGFADLDAAASACNDGQIFRFLLKPCRPVDMLAACDAGAEQHRLRTAERVLLAQT
jgi:DNA-binding NtrC family response regulator